MPTNSRFRAIALFIAFLIGWGAETGAGLVSELSLDDVAGPYGSSSGSEYSQTISPATSASSPSYNLFVPGVLDGSYARADATATFGHLHVYAESHRTYNTNLGPTPPLVGNAQARAWVRFIDYIPASTTSPLGYASYLLTLQAHGMHSFDAYPDVVFALATTNYHVYDVTTSQTLFFGTWTSSDAQPDFFLQHAITGVAANDLLQIQTDFEADAFVMSNNHPNNLTAVSDYSHTLDVYFDATTPGTNTIGLSGHDYATPNAVPVPSSLVLAAGFLGIAGFATLRRRIFGKAM